MTVPIQEKRFSPQLDSAARLRVRQQSDPIPSHDTPAIPWVSRDSLSNVVVWLELRKNVLLGATPRGRPALYPQVLSDSAPP
jgi:hypothetical protein